MSGSVRGRHEHDAVSIFEPFVLGSVTLANRFVMPAMQRGLPIDQPDEQLIEYYRSRAKGGVSLLISESCVIDHPTGCGQPQALYINDSTVQSWARCVDAVHEAGSAMFIQLFHEGAVKKENAGPRPDAPTISPSGLIQRDKRNGREATAAELDELIEAYVKSALAAEAAGADGVEIHGAHGYLLDQFLWAETNLRTDGYGGADIRDRVRFPAAVVKAVRASVSSDFLVGFRFSQWKEVDYDARVCESPQELELMLSALTDAGVDLFHASTRYYYKPEWDTDRTIAAWCKELTDVPVIMVGSVGLNIDTMTSFLQEQETESTAEETIEDLQRRIALGEFDLVALGRSVIGDADWVRKVSDGRFSEIRPFLRSDLEMSEWNLEFLEKAEGQQR